MSDEQSPWKDELPLAKPAKAKDKTIGCTRITLYTIGFFVLAVAGLFIWFITSFSWTKGRPLRGRGLRRSARKRSHGSAEERAAAHWRNMAQEEHESIAAFSELALDLMAAGAPAELVDRCHRAALEEGAHTRLCLDIATSIDGEPSRVEASRDLKKSRGRPRWRTALLARLAAESYLDGCLGEGSSARVLGQLVPHAEPDLRSALTTLAREEMGHAKLSADIVNWSVAEGGRVVHTALAITRRWSKHMRLKRTDADTSLRRYGVPDDELRRQAMAHAQRATGTTLAAAAV